MTAAEAVTLFVAGSTCQRRGRRGGAKDAKGSERGEAPEVSGTASIHRDVCRAARERAVPPRPSRRLGVAGFVDAAGAEEAQGSERGEAAAVRGWLWRADGASLSFGCSAAPGERNGRGAAMAVFRRGRDLLGKPSRHRHEERMSVETRVSRLSVTQFRARKGKDKLVCLTAYTAPVARLLDDAVDLLLVGDSLAMVIYGFDSTLPVTLDMMIAHGAAVVRATRRALVAVDLPFGSYQESPEQAFRAAARVMAETGCAAVKLEGGEEMAETVAFLTRRGIPVMGHVGLTPQSVNTLGGYRSRGHGEAESAKILADGVAIAEAGAFALVVEGVAESVGRELTARVAVPTIGIGASAACDGQILVTDDMLGLFAEFTPKFVKRYRELGAEIGDAARDYAEEVRSGRFPAPEHTYAARRR